MKRLLICSAIFSLFWISFAFARAEEAADLPLPAFIYDGKPADFSKFEKNVLAEEQTESCLTRTVAYTAPDGKLRVTVKSKNYKKFPVTDYSINLENLSMSEPTGVVEHFKSLDRLFPSPEKNQGVTLDFICGSTCVPADFTPRQLQIKPKERHEFRTPSGRSSNDAVPFFEINFNEKEGKIVAIGWTGAWAADILCEENGVRVVAGMDKTHFKLLPGESIRQPTIAVFSRDGQTRREFKTVVHRFMIDEISPRDTVGQLQPPIFAITAGGGNKTPEMMLAVLRYAVENRLPFNTYWVDAGWYGAPHEDEHYSNCGPNWGRFVGDWRINTTTHPTGDLLPIADAVHRAGMKFLLWFEPERMEGDSPILAEHPEYRNRNLVDYGNPEALAWIQETIYGIIAKHKINIYRQDFNMEPGPVWAEMDKADRDRVGIAEARHVTGLYKFLDDMKIRFPNIQQENCASGGRRLDYEMISRAYPYCRSDYPIGQKPGDTAFIFSQNATLNTVPFIPFQGSETNCAPVFDDYAMASCFATGTVFTPTDLDGGIVRREFSADETAWFQKSLTAGKRMCDLSCGDFYPLTDETSAENNLWCAWQLNDSAKNTGYAIAFRRAKAPEESRTFALGGIDPAAEYDVEIFQGSFDGTKKTLSGKELAEWTVSIPKRSFALVFYNKK